MFIPSQVGTQQLPFPAFFHIGVHLPWLIPLLYPSFPFAESILLFQEVMEKLQRVNQSLELTLMALEDVQSRLEKHLEHLKAIPDLDGEQEWVWRINRSWWVPTPGSSPSHRSEPKCHLLQHPTQLVLHAPDSPTGASIVPGHPSPPLPCFQHPRHLSNLHSPGPCCGRWDECGATRLGTHHPVWGLCPLPPSCFPTGHWLVASTCCGARRIRPVVPREEPRYRLTSTPER